MKRHFLSIILMLITATATATDTLRIMTYNVHSGFPVGTSSKNYVVTDRDMKILADLITSAAPHVVAIQEIQCEWGLASQTTHTTSYLNEPRMLAAFTGMHYVFGSAIEDHDYPTTNQEYLEWGEADQWQNNGARHGEYGNVVLSRDGFVKTPESYPLPALPEKEPRQFLRVEPKLERKQRVIVYATHLAHDSVPSRVHQMKTLLQRASAEPKDAIVFIAGDLNYVPGSPGDLMALAKEHGFHDLHESFASSHGKDPDFTFRSDKPDRRIDYILCNHPLTVTRAEVIRSTASDHMPLVIDVGLE